MFPSGLFLQLSLSIPERKSQLIKNRESVAFCDKCHRFFCMLLINYCQYTYGFSKTRMEIIFSFVEKHHKIQWVIVKVKVERIFSQVFSFVIT